MTPQVIAVRQNLTLLVYGGRAVAGLDPYDTSVWGATLGSVPAVWRSGLGVTRNGALVYVTGPDLEYDPARRFARPSRLRSRDDA